MRNAVIFVSILGLAILVGYLILRSSRRAPRLPPPISAASVEEIRKQRRELLTQEEDLGLIQGTLRHDAKNIQFEVSINVQRACRVGDLDAVKLDLEHSKVKRILLTVEPVLKDDRTFKPLVREVEERELYAGFTHEFEIPRQPHGLELGIFLCKDSSRAGHCNGKDFEDLNLLFMKYSSLRNEPYEAPDRSYFFQYLHIQDGETVSVFDKAAVPGKSFTLLPKYVRTAGSSDPRLVDDQVKSVKSLTGALVSLPLRLGPTIRVDLPMLDKTLCYPAPTEKRLGP